MIYKQLIETAPFEFRLLLLIKHNIPLYIEGKEYTPEGAALYFAKEDPSLYMPDYIHGEDGNLAEVRFDKVVNR